MVSARPQFEAACQLQKFAGLAQWQCRELVPLRRVFDSLDQLQIRWRDWPNGLGTGLWLQLREFDSLISPQLGGSYKGDYPRPAPVRCEFESRTVHQILARELDGRVLV